VAGEEKAAIFGAIRSGNSDVPAARVRPVGELIWFADQAAAGGEQVTSPTGARAR
jgi:6-phosphogluconolactonase